MSIESINRRSAFLQQKIRAGRASRDERDEYLTGGHFVGNAECPAFIPNTPTSEDEMIRLAQIVSAECRGEKIESNTIPQTTHTPIIFPDDVVNELDRLTATASGRFDSMTSR